MKRKKNGIPDNNLICHKFYAPKYANSKYE